jgi:hypothetical protein
VERHGKTLESASARPGHGSPTIVGNRVYLAAAEVDEQVQSVISFDRSTGEQLWKIEVHRGGFDPTGTRRARMLLLRRL